MVGGGEGRDWISFVDNIKFNQSSTNICFFHASINPNLILVVQIPSHMFEGHFWSPYAWIQDKQNLFKCQNPTFLLFECLGHYCSHIAIFFTLTFHSFKAFGFFSFY
jgi:hypothetical protein